MYALVYVTPDAGRDFYGVRTFKTKEDAQEAMVWEVDEALCGREDGFDDYAVNDGFAWLSIDDPMWREEWHVVEVKED